MNFHIFKSCPLSHEQIPLGESSQFETAARNHSSPIVLQVLSHDSPITVIPKDTKIEDIKEFFQIEVMTSSPSPNFFQIEDIAF